MKEVYGVNFKPGTKEELLPNFDPGFPCITTCYQLKGNGGAPWHWHEAVELFYVGSGILEYITPSEQRIFPAGSGGIINCNVPHMTRVIEAGKRDRQFIHLFDPVLISGSHGNRIDEKYVVPFVAAPGVELLGLSPKDEVQAMILEKLRSSFLLQEDSEGYEFRLRAILTEIWYDLVKYVLSTVMVDKKKVAAAEQIRTLLVYIHEHCSERITVADLARETHISERSCFSLFKKCLNASPMGYVQEHRLRMACERLACTDDPVTEVAAVCGLGSSSYFATVFREYMQMSPLEYRKKHRKMKEC